LWWAEQQINILEEGRYEELDHEGLLELLLNEIQFDKLSVERAGRDLFAGLLRLRCLDTPQRQAQVLAVKMARNDLKILITSRSTTLKCYWIQNTPAMYRFAREIVLSESDVPDEAIPTECPFSVQQLLDDEFFQDPHES